MHDIAVSAVGILAAGHDDEEPVARINDFDVMHGQRVVKRDRNNGFHGAFVEKFSDFDIGDLHMLVLPREFVFYGGAYSILENYEWMNNKLWNIWKYVFNDA